MKRKCVCKLFERSIGGCFDHQSEAAEKLIAFGYTRVYDVGSLVGWPYGLEWG